MAGIVRPDGTPFLVRQREVVGVEPYNAAMEWEEAYYRKAIKEHDSQGLHPLAYHLKGWIRLTVPRETLGDHDRHIDDRSFYLDKTHRTDPGHIGITQVVLDGLDVVITLGVLDPLPEEQIVFAKQADNLTDHDVRCNGWEFIGDNPIITLRVAGWPHTPIDVFIYGEK